jgi:hypothetical protein
MMPERSYILPFNLNGYNHMQLEKRSFSISILAKKWQEKIMLNRVITEIKKSSVKKLRQRDTHLLIKKEAE